MKISAYPPTQITGLPPSPGLPPFDTALPARHGADLHGLVLRDGEAVGRASLWYRQVPTLAQERLGVVGHFDAVDADSAVQLLSWATEKLAAEGCTRIVGPMDGNTWRRYRFVTDAGSNPAFFLEPENPPYYPHWFQQAGFSPLAHYSSALVDDLTQQDPRIPQATERLRASGVNWRPLNMDRFEEELKAIHRLSLASFRDNFLYTPIGEEEFIAQYRAITPYVLPDLTLMAERNSELVGYLFGIPDYRQSPNPDEIDTVIIKTVAVLPGRQQAGLGSVLVAESQRIAHDLGYHRAIHALMHEGNRSRNISARYARTIRRYTLFEKRLATP